VSNEVTTVCTMQGYKPRVSIKVSVGVCILSQCILTKTIRMFSNEVTEHSRAVSGYDEQTRCVHVTMEYIVGNGKTNRARSVSAFIDSFTQLEKCAFASYN
jgi:hypothetical protein